MVCPFLSFLEDWSKIKDTREFDRGMLEAQGYVHEPFYKRMYNKFNENLRRTNEYGIFGYE